MFQGNNRNNTKLHELQNNQQNQSNLVGFFNKLNPKQPPPAEFEGFGARAKDGKKNGSNQHSRMFPSENNLPKPNRGQTNGIGPSLTNQANKMVKGKIEHPEHPGDKNWPSYPLREEQKHVQPQQIGKENQHRQPNQPPALKQPARPCHQVDDDLQLNCPDFLQVDEYLNARKSLLLDILKNDAPLIPVEDM